MATKSRVVLCEDEAQWLFVYRWLLARGVSRHEIVLLPFVPGSGAQHVIDAYAKEVQAYRMRAGRAQSRCLVVAIDADVGEIAARLEALEARLRAAGLPPRDRGERVCVLVPRRNIETWLHHLHGQQVDEQTDYKAQRLYVADDLAPACKTAGVAFDLWLRAADPAPAPPSLVAARMEAARVP